ncbi:MAG: outer membrane beta-barrel protein [Bacteroidia bacterium]|nr:outer membrane beta-barrel protein [Bacteroidia bacterium]
MKKGLLILSFLMLIGAGSNCFAQTSDDPNNTAKLAPKQKIMVSGNEKFDLMVSSTFLIPTGIADRDSFPWDASRSGALSLAMSFNFPIGSVVAFKIEPRATWHKLTFRNNVKKVFPSDTNLYAIERFRGFYAETPIGFRINLVRNLDEKVKLFAEFGGIIGYNLGGTFKRRVNDDKNRKLWTEKYHQFDDFNPWRYGPYVRLSTNWIGIHAFYRMSDLYRADRVFWDPAGTGKFENNGSNYSYAYPKISPLEIGIFLML